MHLSSSTPYQDCSILWYPPVNGLRWSKYVILRDESTPIKVSTAGYNVSLIRNISRTSGSLSLENSGRPRDWLSWKVLKITNSFFLNVEIINHLILFRWSKFTGDSQTTKETRLSLLCLNHIPQFHSITNYELKTILNV